MKSHYLILIKDYVYYMNGSGNLYLEGGKLIMNVNFSYSLVGNSSLGTTIWNKDHWEPPFEPTITDDSDDFTANWIYSFNLE